MPKVWLRALSMGFTCFLLLLLSGAFKVYSSSSTWNLSISYLCLVGAASLWLTAFRNNQSLCKVCHALISIPNSKFRQDIHGAIPRQDRESSSCERVSPGSCADGATQHFLLDWRLPTVLGIIPGPLRGREKPQRGDSYHRQGRGSIQTLYSAANS